MGGLGKRGQEKIQGSAPISALFVNTEAVKSPATTQEGLAPVPLSSAASIQTDAVVPEYHGSSPEVPAALSVSSHTNTGGEAKPIVAPRKGKKMSDAPLLPPVGKGFKFPHELAERLRRYTFEQRRKELHVVLDALDIYLKRRGY